jgi:hypothetical protein
MSIASRSSRTSAITALNLCGGVVALSLRITHLQMPQQIACKCFNRNKTAEAVKSDSLSCQSVPRGRKNFHTPERAKGTGFDNTGFPLLT